MNQFNNSDVAVLNFMGFLRAVTQRYIFTQYDVI